MHTYVQGLRINNLKKKIFVLGSWHTAPNTLGTLE